MNHARTQSLSLSLALFRALQNYEYISCKITFQLRLYRIDIYLWTADLQRDDEVLAGLEVDALELRTALGEPPVGVAGQLLAARGLYIGTGLDADLAGLQAASHRRADALRLVLLVGQQGLAGQLVEALAGMGCKTEGRSGFSTQEFKNINKYNIHNMDFIY